MSKEKIISYTESGTRLRRVKAPNSVYLFVGSLILECCYLIIRLCQS